MMSPFGNVFRRLSGLREMPLSTLAAGGRNAAIVAVLVLLNLSSSGCSVMHNGYSALTQNGSWNDTVVVLRNRTYSAKAWHRRKHHFCKEKHTKDFCNGFRAGYEAMCSGVSDGCTPAFPPSEYWSWEYQSGEGQARTSAWFSGYPHGVRAAEEEGTANWNQLQMSAGMQSQFYDAGVLTHPGALYPIPNSPIPNNPVPNNPAYGASEFGASQFGSPEFGIPEVGIPAHGTPQYGAPQGLLVPGTGQPSNPQGFPGFPSGLPVGGNVPALP